VLLLLLHLHCCWQLAALHCPLQQHQQCRLGVGFCLELCRLVTRLCFEGSDMVYMPELIKPTNTLAGTITDVWLYWSYRLDPSIHWDLLCCCCCTHHRLRCICCCGSGSSRLLMLARWQQLAAGLLRRTLQITLMEQLLYVAL
jgi:hypothetical protein